MSDDQDALARCQVLFASAREGNWDEVATNLEGLIKEHGTRGVTILVLGCADTLILHQGSLGNSEGDGVIHMPVYVDEDGAITPADEVRPEVRWAGRFIAARAAMDQEACSDLIDSCTPEEYARNVVALLEVASLTLNAMLSGEPEQ